MFQCHENKIKWMQVLEKYGADPLLGRHLRWAGHGGEVELPIFGGITGMLRWCHEGPNSLEDSFYFNCVGRDLSKAEFEELKVALVSTLGPPDEVSDYFELAEPTWTNGKTAVRLYHVNSHGSGYERIEVSTNSDWLKTA